MSEAMVAYEQKNVSVPMGNDMFFNAKAFEHAQRVAAVFAKSSMVPDQFRGNIGNCLIAMNFAQRVNADIFAVMQNMFVIHGKPGIEAKLVIALVNQSGRFEPMEFEEDDDGCVAMAKERKSGKTLWGPKITWEMVKAEGWLSKNGSKWQTLAPLMFRYRAATYFARIYCPEVLLGMQTKEELEDVYVDMAPSTNGSYSLKEKSEQKVVALKSKLEAAKEEAPPEPPPQTDPPPWEEDQDADTVPAVGTDTAENPVRAEFINLKTAGFSTWVHKNKERIRTFDEGVQKEIRDKWQKVYGETTFPLDKQQPASSNGDMIWCPAAETRKYVKLCESCDKAEHCQPYQEYQFENTPED